jgi:hypothetical protein
MCCFIPLFENINFFIIFVQKRDVFVCDLITTILIVTKKFRFILHGFCIQINPRWIFHIQWPFQLKISCWFELQGKEFGPYMWWWKMFSNALGGGYSKELGRFFFTLSKMNALVSFKPSKFLLIFYFFMEGNWS